MRPLYRRILLKLSGESFMGEQAHGLDLTSCEHIAFSLKQVLGLGVQVGLVVGGGNFFRGQKETSSVLPRASADRIGMLATQMNGIFLAEILRSQGVKVLLVSALSPIEGMHLFEEQMVDDHLKTGHVVIFVGGTGYPFFTTDTASALRACQIKADVLIKATKVDGVYNKDPKRYPDAIKYDTLTYDKALGDDLKVMDAASIALCRDNRIPLIVMNFFVTGALLQAVCDPDVGTKVN